MLFFNPQPRLFFPLIFFRSVEEKEGGETERERDMQEIQEGHINLSPHPLPFATHTHTPGPGIKCNL